MIKRVTGAMLLNTTGITLERVDHPPAWLATRDQPYRLEDYPGYTVEWYRGVQNNSDYVRMWPTGDPCPYEKDMYDLLYSEDLDDDEG